MRLEETESGRSMLQICRHTTSRCGSGHTHVQLQKHMNYVDILIMEFWVYIHIHESTFSEMYQDYTAELTST